ncbi:putative outer membrane protein [Escherichia coli]|uniref:Putative outer membrane protein n=1 Tax=Escherichia coli TaxID=562 RepID=A0A376TYB1_ECOLX|nr:putative outer membrane protein [Escherichia coli]
MVLKEYPKTAVNVIGYTDSTGGHDLNMRLSQQRADSVASALITPGRGRQPHPYSGPWPG